MVYRLDTFKNVKGIVVQQFLKVLHSSVIPNRFYKSPKLQNWMCELCTFSQIWSHMQLLVKVQLYISLYTEHSQIYKTINYTQYLVCSRKQFSFTIQWMFCVVNETFTCYICNFTFCQQLGRQLTCIINFQFYPITT